MKKKSIFKSLLFLGAIFLLQSCESNDEPLMEEAVNWQERTRISFKAAEDKETFIWYHDLLTNADYWGNDEVEVDMTIKTNVSVDLLDKVDFYITVEEKDGYNYSAPFNTDGKMISSVSIPESGEFTFKMNADDAYDLYKNDFHNDRSSVLARAGDIFLVYYVITAKDGSTFDSRKSLKEGMRFGLKVRVEDYAPPVWAGTFDYEVIDIGYSCGTLKGQLTFVNEGEGVYHIPSLTFNYCWSGSGKINYDFITGLVKVDPNNDYDDVVWNISNINGTSLDIYWTYYYTASYGEWSKVRLTRTDGANWPTNIYTE